jgi:hypothetical protein
MGILNQLPVDGKTAQKLTSEYINDPFKLASAIANQDISPMPPSRMSRTKSRASRFPLKPIFGGDMPPGLSLVTPFEEKKY